MFSSFDRVSFQSTITGNLKFALQFDVFGKPKYQHCNVTSFTCKSGKTSFILSSFCATKVNKQGFVKSAALFEGNVGDCAVSRSSDFSSHDTVCDRVTEYRETHTRRTNGRWSIIVGIHQSKLA